MLALPNQAEGLAEAAGLSRQQLDRDAWALDAEGGRWRGAAALNRALRELGGPWRLISASYRVPPLGWLEDRAYRWVARNRSRL
ncbi:MAG TPA: DCC1-like thiol-disulfide oxidoreductase family protein [Candidatus Acidoferrales bacterium]|nr:DCC1-like thiol-disulfide oxidoreductase family protein [Candidatus Acidoferrales bacterium]